MAVSGNAELTAVANPSGSRKVPIRFSELLRNVEKAAADREYAEWGYGLDRCASRRTSFDTRNHYCDQVYRLNPS
jgi:hypothetical protein